MQASHGSALLEEAEAYLSSRTAIEALTTFDAAQAAGADADRCSAGRWTAHMLLGHMEEAWLESDAIRKRGAPDPHRFWMGEPVQGNRVILRCLHGFGDAVQGMQYIPALRAHASKLIIEVAPRFVEIAQIFEGVDEVITWGEGAPSFPPEWDLQIEVAELPYVFRTHLKDLPLAERYLHVPHAEDSAFSSLPDTRLRIGIVWASGEWNSSRSVPLEMLRALLQTPGCEFWNLQGGSALQEALELGDAKNFHTDPSCSNSLLRLAQSIAQLDLVITPDTLAAHLAGALGTPAWVMLQHAADWRWMLDRKDSPWYPSLRLFRQPIDGDWTSVIDEIQVALTSITQQPAQEQLEVLAR